MTPLRKSILFSACPEDESGAVLLWTVTDIASDTDTQDMTLYPIDTVSMPTLTDSDVSDSNADELTSFPWRSPSPLQTVSYECDGTEAAQQVLTQSPAASTEVPHDEAIAIVASTGPTCSLRRQRR